jgi:hypothetical protein
MGMSVIEIVIGLVFIYLLLSLFASIINEIIASSLSLRGRFLVFAIRQFIDDEHNILSKDFLRHPFFQKISPPCQFSWFRKVKLPSYLDKADFAKIFLESFLEKNSDNGFKAGIVDFEEVKANIKKLRKGGTRQYLLSLVYEAEKAENKLEKFRENLENGYESLMDRASGWYKRRIQLFLFLIGFVIAVGINADTFVITNQLSENPELRVQLADMAENFHANADSAGLREYYEMSVEKRMDPDFLAQLKALSELNNTEALKLYSNTLQLQELMQEQLSPVHSMLGLGSIFNLEILNNKQGFWAVAGWILLKLLGWTLTALAISLGAPFWFDLLNKVMKMRSSGKTS